MCMRDVLKHMIDFLEDDFLYSIFGQDYTSVLLDNICPVSGYCHLFSRQSLNGNAFHTLLVMYRVFTYLYGQVTSD
jgi:hypothetical protein